MSFCRLISTHRGAAHWGIAGLLLTISFSLPVVAQVAPEPITPEAVTSEPVAPEPIAPEPTGDRQASRAAMQTRAYIPSLELPPIQPVWPESRDTRLVLKLGERRVYVYQGSQVETSFPVAVGKPGWETPVGTYEVISMLQNPGWVSPFTGEQIPPGPNNPLGERWIGFWTDGQNFIGFHGTPTRNSVGQAASHGCVRMFNEDILQLYELVDVGTTVVVEK